MWDRFDDIRVWLARKLLPAGWSVENYTARKDASLHLSEIVAETLKARGAE